MQSLCEYNLYELAELAVSLGMPKFRAKQLYQWIFDKWVEDYNEMTNLPKNFLTQLAEHYTVSPLKVLETLSGDETVKWLSELSDGNTIETVLIQAPFRNTVCISTQVGCAVRCVFCASGRNGLVRNLTKAEILGQVIQASRYLKKRIDNIVVMGMGEPLHNFDNLLLALDELCNPDGFNLGARHVTISTSGVPDGIRALADTGRQWNLALSLHAVSDEARAKIIPDHHRSPLEEIFESCEYHRQKTGRMLTLEFALIKGQNDSLETCESLAEIARRLRAKVNLIPCNPAGSKLEAPNPDNCRAFADALTRMGIQATIRLSKGRSINASCGQLRQRTLE